MPGIGGSSRKGQGASAKYLFLGGGDAIYGIKKTVVNVDPGNITATTKLGVVVAVPGTKVGDIVQAVPPAALEDDLVPAGAIASGTDQVTLYLYNGSGSPVDGTARDWTFVVTKFNN